MATREALSVILSVLVLAGPPLPVAAQSESPVVISVGAHALTAPWHLEPFTSGFNPALLAGTERSMRSGDRWTFFYALSLGFIRHRWWITAFSLEPELGIGRRLPGGLYADVRVGLGYMHYFWRRNTLELEGGHYVETTDWGRPSLLIPLSATVGYRGTSHDPLRFSPFLAARWGLQALFTEEVPAITHLSIQGGIRIERGRNDSREGR